MSEPASVTICTIPTATSDTGSQPPRRYRVLPVNRYKERFGVMAATIDAPVPDCCEPSVDDEDTHDITRDPAGGFKCAIDVPKQFHRFIVGRQGAVRRSIQSDTGATLIIPKPDARESEPVLIKASSEASIVSAKNRIGMVAAQAWRSLDYTHFVSIPLPIDPEVYENLKSAAAASDDANMSMIPIEQLHITLLMLKCFTETEIKHAQAIMESLKPRIYDAVDTRSLILSLNGLDIMNDDPSDAHIVYLGVGGRGVASVERIYRLVSEAFTATGFSSSDELDRQQKLHVTLMRSRKGQRQGQHKDGMDVTQLMETFGSAQLGEVRAPSVELSRRGAFDRRSGFWVSDAAVLLP